jgi:hypothetical protein
MAMNYQTIIEKDFSSGINKLAAEDAVPVSFVENLENMDPNAQGYIEKRKGYQAYAGSLPLRVAKAERSIDGKLFLYFDELEGGTAAIDFSTLKSSPVILYGTTTLKPATTATSYYYSSFIVDPRVVLGTPTTLQAADVGATTRDLFVGLGWNYQEGTKNNEIVYADTITINPSTFNVSIGSIEGQPGDVKCFVYINNHATLAGESWAGNKSTAPDGNGKHVFSINQATHQLNTQNYITRFYTSTGIELLPEQITVTGGSTITASFAQALVDVRVVIRAVPEIDVATGRTAKKDQETTLNIPISADFAFIDIYEINGSTLSRVLPNQIRMINGVAEIKLINETADNVSLKIVWERASVRTNKLALADTATTFTSTTVFQVGDRVKYNGTAWVLDATSNSIVQKVEGPVNAAYTYTISEIDLVPQLCLYGLDHSVLYPETPNRAGWVTHIDAYKSEGENYLIAGLGWNLFKAVTDASLPSRQPLLRTSVANAANVGPLFGPAGRDRKSYNFTGGAEGWANIVSIAYQANTGWTRVVVSTPSRTSAGAGSGVDVEHDRLTIQGSSQKVHRGEWAIMAFSEQATTLTFDVMNPNVVTSDYNEDSVGEAGVFTDKVTFNPPNSSVYSLHYGDVLEGDAFPSGLSGSLSCVSTVGSVSWLTGVGERFAFPAGQIYTVRKVGRILQVRDVNNPAINPFENFVTGDVLELTDRDRRHRIQHLVPADVTGITVEVDGELGETTITNVDSSPFSVGQWILLSSAGRFSGEYRIKELPNTGTITLDSSNVKDTSTPASFAGPFVAGKTIEVGYEDEFTDDANSLLSIKVPLRWFPLENPSGSPARVKHFETSPFTNQPFVRSVMAQDNMYFANYNDHLLKYDGVNLYRSGLIRWQPQVFAAPDTTSTAKIIVPAQKSVTMSADSTKLYLKATVDTSSVFPVGTRIEIAGSSLNPFTVESIDIGNHHVFLNKAPDITQNNTTIKEYLPSTYRYYFRLYALDSNDNDVISAATGSNEFHVSLTQSAAIRLRLIGLPKFEQLDYKRIYIEVYRTKRNSVAPFYSVYKKLLPFDMAAPYVDIIDTISDEALPAQPDDFVATALKGSGIGTGLSQPPQAKYVTVANNSLILANIQDDPKITVDIVGNPLVSDFAGKLFRLRKDSTSQVNDLTFEMLSTGEKTISLIDPETDAVNLTVDAIPTGLAVGHWVYLYDNAVPTKLLYAGWYKVTDITGLIITVAKKGEVAAASFAPNTEHVTRLLACTDGNGGIASFPVYLNSDFNYGWNNANNENIYPVAARVLLRLSNAINFSQTVADVPWCYANAGYDLGGQTLTIQFPENSLKTTPELVMPASLGAVEYYGNGVKVSQATPPAETTIGAVTNKFPSRVVISYPNFSEVFDLPFDISSTRSESIVDVNPADGQEITGVFPFFSESTFSASLKSSSVIVFKSNSIYIIDPATRRAQQIESNGLGCTAPYSIAATREGLMFANEAGLYRLTRSLTVEPIGSYIDRLWREGINKSQLALLQGHAYSVGRKYKVSVPRTGESVPQDVLVYDYTREDSKNTYGSWTRYTNHAATGWCNLLEDAYFASTVGRVYKVSNENSKYDYQDDGQAIDGSVVFRALDFGDSAVRKRVLHLLVHYRMPNLDEGQVDISSATVSMGVNLVDNYLSLDTFKLDVPNSPDGLSTLTPNKQITIRYAVRNPKSLYFQVKIQDNGLHTPLQVTGLSFRVAGLSTEGITEAAQTTKE